ncbi:MAG: hypothetical protein AAF788_02655, partial [Pseudomonadota bacterium]
EQATEQAKRSIGSTARQYETLLVPVGYAFAIWLPLFGGALLFALWMTFSPRNREPEVAKVGWLAIVAFFANTVWAIHQPLMGPGFLSFAVLEVILLFSFLSAKASWGIPDLQMGDRIACAPLFALMGWLFVASPAGLTVALRFMGMQPLGGTERIEALIVLGVWLLIAAALSWSIRSWVFAGTVIWGLVGVAMANRSDGEPLLAQAAIASVGVVVIATLISKLKGQRSVDAAP